MRKIFIIDDKKAILTEAKSVSGNVTQIHELSELEDTAIDRMSVEEKLFAYNNKDGWRFKIATDEDMIEMWEGLFHLGRRLDYMEVNYI